MDGEAEAEETDDVGICWLQVRWRRRVI